VVVQRHQRQPGLDLEHPHQRAPVEALDRHLAQHVRPADLAGGDLDELLAGRGLVGRPSASTSVSTSSFTPQA
jgi:hypothetical protein